MPRPRGTMPGACDFEVRSILLWFARLLVCVRNNGTLLSLSLSLSHSLSLSTCVRALMSSYRASVLWKLWTRYCIGRLFVTVLLMGVYYETAWLETHHDRAGLRGVVY